MRSNQPPNQEPSNEPIIIPHSTLWAKLPDALINELSAIAAHHGWSVDYLLENLLAHYLGQRHYVSMDALLMARDQYRDDLQSRKEGEEESLGEDWEDD